jgi:hypothetical protein
MRASQAPLRRTLATRAPFAWAPVPRTAPESSRAPRVPLCASHAPLVRVLAPRAAPASMRAPRAPLGPTPATRTPLERAALGPRLPSRRRTSLCGTRFRDLVGPVDVSCVALAAARHPQRGFMDIPSPVHNLGAEDPLLGTGLWTTGDCLWINLAQARVVHGHPELSQGSPQAPSPGLDTSRRGGTRVIHTIHRTYYYYWFSLEGLSTKKKQGGACARTHASRSGSKEARGRLERASRTLYGGDQRLVLPRGGARKPAHPRVWKGLS